MALRDLRGGDQFDVWPDAGVLFGPQAASPEVVPRLFAGYAFGGEPAQGVREFIDPQSERHKSVKDRP